MGRLLVDSNSYLRIARSFPALLGVHGELEFRVLPNFDREYLRSARLRTKFTWPNDPPHPGNRSRWSLAISATETKSIADTRHIVAEFAEDALKDSFEDRRKKRPDGTPLPFLSPQDLTLMCHAVVLGLGIVTDERPMRKVAKDYGVPVMTSLEVLRYLVGQKAITTAQVEGIVKYWQFDGDAPYKGWQAEYRRLFKKEPPKP